jgi:hypothetical protein
MTALISSIRGDATCRIMLNTRQGGACELQHEVTGVLALLPIAAGRTPCEYGLYTYVAYRASH